LPHILALRDKFTKYKIKDVYQFTSAYTWRLYELLIQNKDMKKRDFDLEEFKWKIGVAEKYCAIGDLKKRVIDPSIDEINEYSDIKIQYDQVKRGRRVTGFVFYITENRVRLSGSSDGGFRFPELSNFVSPPAEPGVYSLLLAEHPVDSLGRSLTQAFGFQTDPLPTTAAT